MHTLTSFPKHQPGAATWGSRSAAFAAAAAAAEGTAVQLDGTPEFNRPAGALGQAVPPVHIWS